MSESNTALLEAPPVDEADGDAPSPDRRKLFMILGAAAAVVVVGLLAFLFLGGSSSEDEGGLVTPAPRSAPAAAAPAPAAPADKAPAAYDGDLGRDPFAPVYEPAAPETAADPAAVGTTGGTGSATAGGATGTDTATTTGTGTPVTVKLLAVTTNGASLTVDGTKYNATVNGETFATSFRLYSVFDEQCAGLLFGDESVVMCKGDVRTLTP
jgi:pyruvate/2-oxoglutarate dehydrogenase complex dihydrolipoamide acyltransferase (E2) component